MFVRPSLVEFEIISNKFLWIPSTFGAKLLINLGLLFQGNTLWGCLEKLCNWSYTGISSYWFKILFPKISLFSYFVTCLCRFLRFEYFVISFFIESLNLNSLDNEYLRGPSCTPATLKQRLYCVRQFKLNFHHYFISSRKLYYVGDFKSSKRII